MKKEKIDYWLQAGRWVNRLRIKSTWVKFINGDISYGDYKDYLFAIINPIRKAMGDDIFSYEKFDEAWQYRNMAHENWEIALNEIKNTIVGFW